MILTSHVEIKITKRNINFYINLGYNEKLKDKLNIPVKDLTFCISKIIKVKCDICGNKRELKYYIYNKNIIKNTKYYCNKCKFILIEKTNLQKYGNKYSILYYKTQKKIKNTIQKKYNVDNISQIEFVKEKIIKTNLKKYGVDNPMKSDIIKKRKIDNIKNKYGVENVFQLKSVKEKLKKTNLEKYGEEFNINSDYIKNKIIETKNKKTLELYKNFNIISVSGNTYTFLCEKGHTFNISMRLFYNRKQKNTIICTICNHIKSIISGYEIQLQNFIKKNTKNILTSNRKTLNGKELDIYIPELKLAFEFNGLYWHNELYKDKNYHLNKTELCEEKGVQLIHIWEDNWINKQDIVKSMILNKLGKTQNKIYGRKTIIKEITDNKIVREFLIKNHLQGFIGSKVKLGLYYDNELVSLMTLGKRRVAMGKKKSGEGEYELLRYCNKLNTNVLGGASKLFKYFIEQYKPKEITTYADRSHSDGKLYETLGFKFVSKTQPNYYYIIDDIRHHRFNFRKDKLIKEGFDPNKTEHQIMLDRNIYRIFDSGNLKFTYP